MDYIDNNENYNEDDNINDISIIDEIIELENLQDKIESDIKKLWKIVIVPYINNNCYIKILDKLNENDCYKFYKFMLENNDLYKYTLLRIHELKNSMDNNLKL